tara:strand:- start:143 stop:343 length:201 start_codon:yes stop_codon:yes gene_type:complete
MAKKDTKERKPKEKKPGKKMHELYDASGSAIERKNKHCPKCGRGTFMGQHKDRHVCGKCKYVEYTN